MCCCSTKYQVLKGLKKKKRNSKVFKIVVKGITLHLPSLPFLSVQFSSVKYIHVITEQISRTFSSYKTNSSPLNTNFLPHSSSSWQPRLYYLSVSMIFDYLCVCVCVCVFRPPWHMKVPGLGVYLELQLPTYTTATAMSDLSCLCDLCHSSKQRWIFNPLSEARDQTCVFMDTSQVRFC